MKSAATLVIVALIAFSLGWWLGGTRPGDGASHEQRIATLERQIAVLSARAAGAEPAVNPPPAEAAAAAPAQIDLDGAPSRGPAEAPVVLVEFSDFQCPYCQRANPTIEKLRQDYRDRLRVVFKHFPLGFHREAMQAHRATLAAGEQGHFWEMHDLIFSDPEHLDMNTMLEHARRLELDMQRFEADFKSPRVAERIDRDIREGRALGVRGTPAFFVNGKLISGAQPYDVFKQEVEAALAGAS